MREIKFRVWNSSESKMIYLDDQSMSVEINFLNNWTYNHKTYWEVVTKEGEPGYPNMSQYVDSRRTENKIMQYTGLKDENGKEIYEGDILVTLALKTRTVEWNEEYSSFGLSEKIDDKIKVIGIHKQLAEKSEVIGNIYENPELLESEK